MKKNSHIFQVVHCLSANGHFLFQFAFCPLSSACPAEGPECSRRGLSPRHSSVFRHLLSVIRLPSSVFLFLLSPVPYNLSPLFAQVPITVRQTDINNGAAIPLPLMTARAFVTGYGDYHWYIASSNFTSSTPIIKIGGNVNGQTALENIGGTAYGTSFMTFWSPTVVFTNNWASSPNSQTLTCGVNWNESDAGTHPYNVNLSQAFTFYLVNDLASSAPSVSLAVSPDYLESISRKETSTNYRKLMGIYLNSNTNSVLSRIAFAVNNTSTNTASFSNLAFYRDSGSGQFSLTGSTLLATTTNANGFAIFNSLSENLSSTNQLYFLAGQFAPSNQTKNSFINASCNSANVICTFTNAAILTTGGNFLGKQYGFLDTTDLEDAATAAAAANQINKAIAAIPPAQTPKASQLNAATLGVGAAAVGVSILGNQLIGGMANQAGGAVKGGPRPGYSEKY